MIDGRKREGKEMAYTFQERFFDNSSPTGFKPESLEIGFQRVVLAIDEKISAYDQEKKQSPQDMLPGEESFKIFVVNEKGQ